MCCAVVWLLVLAFSSSAGAQAAGQLWGTAIVDWLKSDRLTYQIEVEPKAQLIVHEGQPTWIDVATTPHVEYAVAPWIDVLGETDLSVKNQSDEINSLKVTPRVGVRLHILSRTLQQRAAPRGVSREAQPRRRADISTLLRIADEITASDSEGSTKPLWRFRDRFAIAYPFNRPKVTTNGAIYLTTDGELFIPMNETVPGGIVSELRLRSGIGYRNSFAWRFEALYIWDAERNKTSGAMAVDSHALDIRVRREF